MKQPLLLTASLCASFVLAAESAHAADWVDRPLTLGLMGVSVDGALGLGQVSGESVGWGASVEGALGLPIGFEAGLHLGLPFGDTAQARSAEANARLFDQVNVYELAVHGIAPTAIPTPELRLQKSLVDVGFAAAAFDLRAVIPAGDGTNFAIAPGGRVRLRIPRILRVDASLYFPIGFTNPVGYGVDVPVAAWFQAGNLFLGPETGVFYSHRDGGNETDIHLGIGIGHTFGDRLDVKAEMLTTRINDSNWSKYLGAGVGVGLYLP